ncbi:hypothetical protein PMG71_04745 [Roseofilum sp. BLCC_M154]|uniref:Myosin heavy chain n=1 Tax=Roseofilum acuticapitatum BLCC-M154 TaxID=3022444 RepID=A0ABT7ARM4_9CYAN|nr:hypothetical protein [Roseofilum acuticapitatum]MDJ1168728.1 hypothetical protein [Roseofilum acuticapitatum BLCC-M154]
MTPTSSSKSQLMQAFEKIVNERKSPNVRVETKEQEAQREQNQQVVAKVSGYSRDRLVTGLATLHLDLGDTIEQLTEKLSTETDKLKEINQAISVKQEQLQDLKNLRVVADALHLLTQEHNAKVNTFEAQITSQEEDLAKQQDSVRKIWSKEQQGYESALADKTEQINRDRQLQETNHQYELERVRQMDSDDYEERKRQLEHELHQRQQHLEKDWQQREKVLSAQEAEYTESCQKISGYEEELKQAYIKAKEEAIQDANREGKVKSDLLEKEWTGIQQGYELQVQSLEKNIERQTEEITALSEQLQAAVNQAKELAMRAFSSSSNK